MGEAEAVAFCVTRRKPS